MAFARRAMRCSSSPSLRSSPVRPVPPCREIAARFHADWNRSNVSVNRFSESRRISLYLAQRFVRVSTTSNFETTNFISTRHSCLEIISEASRRLPKALKDRRSEFPGRNGCRWKHLRHEYEMSNSRSFAERLSRLPELLALWKTSLAPWRASLGDAANYRFVRGHTSHRARQNAVAIRFTYFVALP